MSHFDIAFDKTQSIEGKGILTNNLSDPGGLTYSGICRMYWKKWIGWETIDSIAPNFSPGSKPLVFSAENVFKLEKPVKDFYMINFWDRIQGDKLSILSPKIAYKLFDTAVNVGVHQAVKFLQQGHNVTSAIILLDDGILGEKSLNAIEKYIYFNVGSSSVNEEILFNCMNGEQYVFYKNNPNHRSNRGWFRRLSEL